MSCLSVVTNMEKLPLQNNKEHTEGSAGSVTHIARRGVTRL